MGLVNWDLSSFTAVLSQSATVTATVIYTSLHTHTHTIRDLLCMLETIRRAHVCKFPVKVGGSVIGHM